MIDVPTLFIAIAGLGTLAWSIRTTRRAEKGLSRKAAEAGSQTSINGWKLLVDEQQEDIARIRSQFREEMDRLRTDFANDRKAYEAELSKVRQRMAQMERDLDREREECATRIDFLSVIINRLRQGETIDDDEVVRLIRQEGN